MKYRLAIFDSDGTLADTLPWARSVFNQFAADHGFRTLSDHDHEELRDLTGRDLLKQLNIPLWRMPAVLKGFRTMMARHIDQFSVFDGVPEMLKQLSAAGIRLAVVSSNSEENVRRILRSGAQQIDFYSCGASMFGKARKLRSVARASNVKPAEAIYLGDEVRDAEAARDAGMAFGAVAWGQHRPETLLAQKPAEFFATVDEIATKLVNLID